MPESGPALCVSLDRVPAYDGNASGADAVGNGLGVDTICVSEVAARGADADRGDGSKGDVEDPLFGSAASGISFGASERSVSVTCSPLAAVAVGCSAERVGGLTASADPE
jgi:hypothetical protein